MNEQPSLRVLVLAAQPERAQALLDYLARCGVGVEVTTSPGLKLGGRQAVLALGGGVDAELLDFARGGGGVVGLHTTLRPAGGLAPETELRVSPQPGHPVTDRLPSELLVRDRLPLLDAIPAGATLLLTAAWRFTEVPLAYELPTGRGRVLQLGLGGSDAALAHPALHSLVYRSLRRAAGLEPAPAIGVGLVGYGAIAREHADAIRATAGLELLGVCDRAPTRRDAAARELSVPTYGAAEGLLEDPAVELVVVGTPPNAHAAGVLQALEAGRHVICEKPFALRTEDVDRMIAAAAARRRLLTVFQSRRWDPDFKALRAAVEEGRIGELFYMESFIGGFSHPCSYWHSHEPVSGGTIFDWGSHYFDWVLRLYGPRRVVSVTASAHKRVWHDVTNADQVRVDLRLEDGAEATFLQSDIAAALKPKWYLLGTRGAIQGDWRLQEASAPADLPSLLTLHTPAGGVERLSQPAPDPHGFYRNLADHLLQGEPAEVLPEEARRNVAVMEAATRSIADGGRRQEVRI